MRYFFKKRITEEDKGTAAIEFAILLPVLLLMFVGLFDISEFTFCYNKMSRMAQNINNIVTRGDVTKPQLDTMLQASTLIAQPFDFTASGSNVIVTAISQTNANTSLPPTVMWRDSYPGGTGGSRVSPGSLPSGLTLATNQTVIFTEVFYTYVPLFPNWNLIPAANLSVYSVAVGVPRQGTMTTLPPS